MKKLKAFAVATMMVIILLGSYTIANAQQITAIGKVLTPKQESIVAIAAFMAKGDQAYLKHAIHNGLDAGLSINEIKEILVQLYAYAGFPRSLNAINTLETALNERRQKGINDVAGKTPGKLTTKKTKFELGKEVQTTLTGTTATGAPQKFVPIIDTFLKEHLFADIFGRNNLDYQSREIATISALASISGLEPQLLAHIKVGMNVGLTAEQVNQLVVVLENKVGRQEGARAKNVLEQVLNPNTKSMANVKTDAMEPLFPKGEKITNNNFTGNAWLHQMVVADSLDATQVGNVTFEPGARTNWHSHNNGQILLVIDGVGYYQEKGSPKRVLRKGDVVKCAPNVPHWHGASRDQHFVQVAITSLQNGTVVWMQKVTDEEYNRD